MPNVDRGPTDSRNVLAVIIDIKYDKYKLGTENGVLSDHYSYHQLVKVPDPPILFVQDVETNNPKSLREVVRLQSITGGQEVLRCDCESSCKTNRCKCKQSGVLCNSRCHHSATCCNK